MSCFSSSKGLVTEVPAWRLDELVARWSSRRPALSVRGEVRLTYVELDAAAVGVARELLGRGVRSGALVGIYMPRDERLIAALLGVLKSGSAYVPLDPAFPQSRVALMLEDARAAAVCTVRSLGQALPPEDAAEKVYLDDCCCCFGGGSSVGVGVEQRVSSSAAPSSSATTSNNNRDLAYVLFTSGSTGRPKGVMIEHRSAVTMALAFGRATGAKAGDVVVGVTTISFDISVLEIFVALGHECLLEFVPTEVAKDGAQLFELLESLPHQQVDLMQATPATWRLLLEESQSRGSRGSRGGLMLTRVALCGGEAMPRDLAEGLLPLVGRLLNVYGPTETCVWSTFSEVTDPTDVHIGTPIENTVCYVLNPETLEPCGVEEPGELFIGGAGVARGYLGRDDLTRERFLDDFGAAGGPPHKMYRTGDLAAWRKDGNLDCLGRIDSQVKIRGYRVECGEVEAVIAKHDHVAVCAVVKDPHKDILVAYCVPKKKKKEEEAAEETESESEESESESSSESSSSSSSPPKSPTTTTTTTTTADPAQPQQQQPQQRSSSQVDLEEVASWGLIYDEAYARRDAVTADPTLNFSGYGNSFTPGAVHRVPTVLEWVERTVERVSELAKPRRVGEMGCGNGMIGFRLAKLPGVEAYFGADLSSEAVQYDRAVVDAALEGRVDALPREVASKICGFQANVGAHEADEVFKGLDTIVCNGVSMYFPGLTYTFDVVQASLDALEDGGAFFLGDVRSLTSHEHFLAATRFFQSLHGAKWRGGGEDPDGNDVHPVHPVVGEEGQRPQTTSSSLKRAVDEARAREKELLIDPLFFVAICGGIRDDRLPKLRGCADFRIDLKRGAVDSEFTLYRYDVTFWKGDGDAAATEKKTTVALEKAEDTFKGLAHGESFLDVVAARLALKPKSLGFAEVPDRRLLRDSLLVDLLQEEDTTAEDLAKSIDERYAALAPAATDAEALAQLGLEFGYDVQVVWTPRAATLKTLDVLFVQKKDEQRPCLATVSARRLEAQESRRPYYANKGDDFTTTTGSSRTPPQQVDDDADAAAAAALKVAAHCRRSTLPEYMVPSAFVFLEGGLPLTPNGKVDRKALETKEALAPVAQGSSDPPQTAVEAAVASACGELLGVAGVGRSDSFYALGGHSLFAARLLRRLGDEFPRGKLDLRDFHDTDGQVKSIAAAIEAKMMDSSDSESPRRVLTPSPGGGKKSEDEDFVVHQQKVVDPTTLPFDVEGPRRVFVPVGLGRSRFPCEDRPPADLAGLLWRPRGGREVPCLIEELPYRCRDGTRQLDAMTWPYLAGRGLACLRLDGRGFGDSTGANGAAEYTDAEVLDLADAVVWAATQDWCDGTVYLVGCSWGGILALRLARQARRKNFFNLPELGGVVAVCATDDIRKDDMHFFGDGAAFKLCDAVPWATRLAALAALPPTDGRKGWRDEWRHRVDAVRPPLAQWWAKQHHPDDPIWWGRSSSHKSVLPTTMKKKLPVFVVGGYAGGAYLNSVQRLLDEDEFEVEALWGPFAHAYPHLSPLGPVCFLTELVEWIRRSSHRVVPMPQVRVFVANSGWHQVDCWKDRPTTDVAVPLTTTTTPKELPSGDLVGDAAGRWFTYGGFDDELPGDQRNDDAGSLCFDITAASLTQQNGDVLLVGRPRLHLTAGRPVVARLCVVAPDGSSSTLVSVGAGDDIITLDFLAVKVPSDAVLRLALTANYWPIAFPNFRVDDDDEDDDDDDDDNNNNNNNNNNKKKKGVVLLKEGAFLELPIAKNRQSLAPCIAPPPRPPQVARPPSSVQLRPPKRDRKVERTHDGRRRLTSIDDAGARRYESDGVVYDEVAAEDFTFDPAHRTATATASFNVAVRRGDVDVRVVAETKVTQDHHHFNLITTVQAFDHDHLFLDRHWAEDLL